MTVTFERNSQKSYTIDVWFDVKSISDGGKETIGTFEKIKDAIEFDRNENRNTVIEVEYS